MTHEVSTWITGTTLRQRKETIPIPGRKVASHQLLFDWRSVTHAKALNCITLCSCAILSKSYYLFRVSLLISYFYFAFQKMPREFNVPDNLNLPKVEEEILARWRKEDTFKESLRYVLIY